MVESEIAGISAEIYEGENRVQMQIVYLRTKDGGECIPIAMGCPEAMALVDTSHLDRLVPPTIPEFGIYDLICRFIFGLGATVNAVVISDLVHYTYYTKLILDTKDFPRLEVDCRPSDALNIAVRTRTPIFVNEEVIRKLESVAGE